MTDIGTRARAAAGNRNTVVVAVLIVLAVIYPTIVESLQSLPLIGDFVPSTDSMVVMIAFSTMAIGLNMVVGYAGLLDLGYVAFYAVGAYTAGWFASQQFDQWSFQFGAVGITDGLPGIHISMWLVLIFAGLLTMLAGSRSAFRPCGSAATTSRSSRSASGRSCRSSCATQTTSVAST